ncbi:hypothetical protein CAEBREN_21796 [Caenorhabditis brenneri]|uniref:Uncharacterized protein n=1 Tax=Caenorhabditis brenneri TaxID=135651 RepID=G0NGS5_CAEBE|nr:hypothetical protein CAEBREN_21796 [Caenorhabditis brenneri]
MKLYCVHVLHKNVDTGDVKIFKSESDLSSFEYFQRSTIQEFMTHTSKILVERSGLGDRSSIKAVIEGEQDCPYPGLKELLERWRIIPEAGPVSRFHILDLPKWILSTIWNIIASYIYE